MPSDYVTLTLLRDCFGRVCADIGWQEPVATCTGLALQFYLKCDTSLQHLHKVFLSVLPHIGSPAAAIYGRKGPQGKGFKTQGHSVVPLGAAAYTAHLSSSISARQRILTREAHHYKGDISALRIGQSEEVNKVCSVVTELSRHPFSMCCTGLA
jgi:hypothetical protein